MATFISRGQQSSYAVNMATKVCAMSALTTKEAGTCFEGDMKMASSFLADRVATRDVQFSVGGKIRVGTKAISKRAAADPTAAALYQKALSGLISFREAEKEIYKSCNISNPFFPRNTQEFHAHPWDMTTGGMATAKHILDLYGEIKGRDSAPKLYRFPVVFPDVQDYDLDTLVGGGLTVQGGGPETIRYRSRYEPDGTRVCVYLPEIVRTEQTKRKVVQHVPRKPVVRGPCVPEECEEYSFGMCKFSGTLRFYIPGIAGAGVFELHTGSTEAASQIYLRLSQAMKTCRGRLPNFTPDGRPVFWISKAKVTRPYFDENGQAKLGEQWVPQLDMEIELPKVMWLKQQEAMLLPSAATAPASGSTQTVVPTAWIESTSNDASMVVDATTTQASSQVQVTDGTGQQSVLSATPLQEGGHGQNGASLQSMLDHARDGGYAAELTQWANARFGQGWEQDPSKVIEAWSGMVTRLGAMTGQWLQFNCEVLRLNLEQELVLRYMKFKIGALKDGSVIPRYIDELKGLCADGASVATELMHAALENAG